MPTPSEVLAWDVSGLTNVATNASGIADAIVKAADTMHTTIHDFLVWKGKAKDAAEGKADRERTDMRALATAYDDLATACSNAHRDMDFPLSEIKNIFQLYVHPPVAVDDNWTVTGVEDKDSEAGVQLARLSGLLGTLLAADTKWGKAIADANGEISRMAPAQAYEAIQASIQKIKKADQNSMSDQIATNPASFWAPDWPGITAATIIGGKTEVTRQIMEEAARQADNPGFLKWVETFKLKGVDVGISRLGIAGGIIGTLPAIADDINDNHMNKTEAIVSESGGTVSGLAAGGWVSSLFAVGGEAGGAEAGALIGAEAGSVVPVVGTVAGLAVGAAVGYLVPKLIQWAW